MHEQDRPVRIGQHIFYQTIAAARVRVCETIEQAVALRIIDRVIEIALFFVAKRLPVADEKLKVPRVRSIDMRIIDFVDDAVAEREPDTATGVIRRAYAFFRAGSPARRDPRSAER